MVGNQRSVGSRAESTRDCQGPAQRPVSSHHITARRRVESTDSRVRVLIQHRLQSAPPLHCPKLRAAKCETARIPRQPDVVVDRLLIS